MALRNNENKVKFGLKRVAFALATIAEDGSATYGDVISFPGARTLSMEPQGAGEPWNADDGVYYFSSAPGSRQGDLEMARIIDSFKRIVLQYIQDAKGLLLEDTNPAEVHFALLFETTNDKKPRRYVMYNCVATAPTVGSATNEGSKEPQTETSTITSSGIYVASHDKWFDHGETTPATDPEAYANWFSAVQVPGPPPAPYPVKTASGSPVVITDGAENMAVEAMTVTVNPMQIGSGDPSPDNVRPISGWTGAKVTRAGSNLADISKFVGITDVTVTFPEEGTCRVVTGGQNTYRAANIRPIDMTYPPGTYYIKFKIKANPTVNDFTLIGLRTVIGNNLNGNLVHIVASATDKSYSAIFTTTNETYLSYIANENTTGEEYGTDITIYDLTVSKLDASYEPYAGETYSIDWTEEAGTVYGGTLNVTTGVLTVDRAFLETTWGAGTFYKSVGNTITGKLFEGLQRFNSTNITTNNSLCNVCPPNIDEMNLESPHFYLIDQISAGMVHNKAYVYLPNDTSDDQVIQIAYPIRTPVTYQLTPAEVRTLLGDNTIWADTGDVTVSYHSDPIFDD